MHRDQKRWLVTPSDASHAASTEEKISKTSVRPVIVKTLRMRSPGPARDSEPFRDRAAASPPISALRPLESMKPTSSRSTTRCVCPALISASSHSRSLGALKAGHVDEDDPLGGAPELPPHPLEAGADQRHQDGLALVDGLLDEGHGAGEELILARPQERLVPIALTGLCTLGGQSHPYASLHWRRAQATGPAPLGPAHADIVVRPRSRYP